ncbi:MAG TPA: superoxide dismutase, Ni [Patescibacteria group bacterium]|nr:superoxide dismutase, Ni [Patescibacteria group bacterium]
MGQLVYRFFAFFLPVSPIYAHCDVPCGIYDPKPAQIAAATVVKMTQLLIELDKPDKTMNDRNKLIRCVLTKEEHARKCKEELLILWTDYFKPEHLSKFPNLHDTFWKATKLCSKAKQEVSLETAESLVKAVDEIAEMFAASKKA